ncbi:glycoside hydrolase superfamily [Aspergillus falconensis]
MPVQLTCYPPLGKVTCLEPDKIRFTVLIEPASQHQWEIQIWHNIGLSQWAALPLSEIPSTALPALSSRQDPGYRGVFAGDISRPQAGTARFTVRYRESPDEEWRWANKEQDHRDGELVFVSRHLTSELAASSAQNFAKYFDNLSPDVQIEVRKSEAPGAALWSVSGLVEGARDGHSGIVRLPLGVPSFVSRFFALARVETSWLGPRQGKDTLDLTEDAILCSFLRTDGVHVVLLGVTVDNILTVLDSGPAGEVVIKSQNDNPAPSQFQVLAAAAENFEIATSALIYEARKLVRPYDDTAQKGSRAQWLSEWYDGLAYCTWNGLGQDLSEKKILSALDDLKTSGIRIKTLIIDDNWQSLDNEGAVDSWHRGWTQFEANPRAFPDGLAKTISTIREQHRNIEYIVVWHALFGYWGGISPEGPLAATYKTREVALNSTTRPSMLTIDPSDIQRFYNDFYAFLSRSGISGVKTDAQSFLDLLANPQDRKAYASTYQDAWTISSLHHFGSKVISCMSQIPQTIFRSQLPTNKPTIVVRNSNDFFPDIEDSHPWHVFCNAHNALLTRYLNVLPDWDMFQTNPADGPDYAAFHATARCISGGPIYITDKPGQHDVELIKQMTASTIQGTTITLRPDIAGRTLDMYHDIREGHILRVGTYHGRAGSGSGIIGVFNVAKGVRSAIIPVADFPGIYDDQEEAEPGYIVRAHRSGKIVEGLHASSTVSVTLNERKGDVLTAYRIKSITLTLNSKVDDSPNERTMTTAKVPAPVSVAVIGLLRKMTGVAALVSSDIYIEDTGRLRVDVGIKALGVLGIYFSCLQEWDIDEHFMVLVSGKPVPRRCVWKENERVLAIDIDEAWHELGLEAGWGNEVWVSVLL